MEREEAIKIVKEFINGTCLHLVDQEALETLIPELAESEEERIRKIITDSVFYLYGAGAEYKDVLDYLDELEKQKDQKPVEWSEDDRRILNRCIDIVETYEIGRLDDYREASTWLKNLI